MRLLVVGDEEPNGSSRLDLWEETSPSASETWEKGGMDMKGRLAYSGSGDDLGS